MPFERVSAWHCTCTLRTRKCQMLCRKKQTLFHWIFDLQTISTSTQLTIRYYRPFCNLFTIQISRWSMNWYSGWFGSGAILTRTLPTWLLSTGVKDFQPAFMQRSLITSCELTHSDRIWLALSNTCSNTPHFTIETHDISCTVILSGTR